MKEFLQGPLGEALMQVMQTLWDAGFTSYLAGGCVRDLLLKRPFKDIDIATDARPEEVEKLFPDHLAVGRQFGIIIVKFNQFQFEVATFRTDGVYRDGRRPESISYCNAKEDAQRRDFTINALFYDLKANKIIDYVDGESDLNKGLIRAVGDPNLRFAEDYLRMLRALRFQVQLQFRIEPNTWSALTHNIQHLTDISGERISDELFKGLSYNPQAMSGILHLSGAWPVLFSYLGERDTFIEANLTRFNKKLKTKGETFSLILLQSNLINQGPVFFVESPQKIKWRSHYDDKLQKMNHQLKLSREDFKTLKLMGAAKTFAEFWSTFRPAFRYELLAPITNGFFCELLNVFGVESQSLNEDLQKAQLVPQNFLSGHDVDGIEPKKRGDVLKEVFYLQWEGKIKSRQEALAWLNQSTVRN